jgi:hypothetical protein
MTNLPPDKSKEVREQTQLQQIVALSLQGVPEYKIAESMDLSRYMVRKVRNSKEFKELMQQEGETALQMARDSFRSKLDSLEPLAFAALKKNLEEGKIEGVKTYVQIVGLLDKKEEKEAADTSITVIMPGAQPQPKDIEVTVENKE